MSNLSKVVRTSEAIVIVRDRTNGRTFEDFIVGTETANSNYRRTLERDAQLIRSEKLGSSGQLISTEESIVEANRKILSEIVYFTPLQEKLNVIEESLFGSTDD